MRPAVHASFLRNRGLYQKRRKRTHVFSPRRLLFMVVSGVLLLIAGLVLTIIGLQNNEADSQGIMRHAVGPVLGLLGISVMFASCIYFNCYGTVPQTPAPLNNQQSLSEQDQQEKGSIRSKQREQGQQQQKQQLNGRSVDVYTPDGENQLTIQCEDGSLSKMKAPHRTSDTTDEDVPLAKMEDSDIQTRGQYLGAPLVAIHIEEPSDTDEADLADTSRVRHSVRWKVEA